MAWYDRMLGRKPLIVESEEKLNPAQQYYDHKTEPSRELRFRYERSYEDIEILQNNNVDFFCLGRAAILDHQFPNRLKAEGSNFQPYSAPVTRDHLLKEGLSETFVNYMATWKNFVSDSA